jgi:STE24 endopeptidase
LRHVILPLMLLLIATHAHAADFDPQAATEAYLKSVPAAAKLKSDAYFEGGYWLILWNALYGIGVAAILLVTGFSGQMRDLAYAIGRWRWVAIGIYGAFFTLVTTVMQLPLDIYQGFFREQAYHLSNQNFAGWLSDDLIGLAVSVVSAMIVLPLIYAAIRAAPRTWWLWGTGVAMAFIVFSVAIGPVFLEPLLNHFQTLPDGPLRTQILAMAHSDGVPATDVKEYDSSRQTNRISAHVSGLFGTTQISLTDNLIKQGSTDEVLAVLGHEMGHYVMGHVLNFVLFLSIIVAVGFTFARWSFARLVGAGGRWGISGIDDPAGLPVLVAAFTLYFLVLTPVWNSLIRMQESQADVFGLNLARRPDAFATVALKLSTYRKLDPSPLEEFVFYDHPSGRTRIFTAMRWKAEQLKADAVKPPPPLDAPSTPTP